MKITELASSTSRRLRTVVDAVAFNALDGDAINVSVTPEMLPVARASLKDLEDLASKAAARSIRVVIVSGGATQARTVTSGIAPGASAATTAASAADMRQHPLVKQAEELFGARLVRVEVRVPPTAE